MYPLVMGVIEYVEGVKMTVSLRLAPLLACSPQTRDGIESQLDHVVAHERASARWCIWLALSIRAVTTKREQRESC